MRYHREREVAVEAVREAARLCVEVQQSRVTALEKADRSPVTVADFGSQALVCRRVNAAFPDDPIVAEEDAAALRGAECAAMRKTVCDFVRAYAPTDEAMLCAWIDAGNGEVAKRFWTLDPIDGTKGFLRGEQYAVALALIDGGEVTVAALACPALPADGTKRGVLFAAVRGRGVQAMPLAGGTAVDIHMGKPAWRFAESVEASHGDHAAQRAVAEAVGIDAPALRMDSQAKYGAVARGDAALYLRLPSPNYPDYRERIWDHAAGALIVEEAGGRVSDMFGNPLDFASAAQMADNRGVVVSGREIHAQIIDALRNV